VFVCGGFVCVLCTVCCMLCVVSVLTRGCGSMHDKVELIFENIYVYMYMYIYE